MKVLVIAFSIAFSAMAGILIPFVLAEVNDTPQLLNLIGETNQKEDEPETDYLTAFGFKWEWQEVYIEDNPNLLRSLISEKHGVANYDGIKSARVETESQDVKCVEVVVNPFSFTVIGLGKSKVFLTATQSNGTEKTIHTTIVVKKRPVEETPQITEEEEKERKKEDVHFAEYEYSSQNGTIKISYYINKILQSSNVFKILQVIGGEITNENIAGEYQFYAQAEWKIIIRHIETGKEITLSYPLADV